jgi:hypothetical protein
LKFCIFLAIFDPRLPHLMSDFCLLQSDFLGHFRPCPSPLKSDIINGRSWYFINTRDMFFHKSFRKKRRKKEKNMSLLESKNRNYFLFAFKKILQSFKKNVGRYVKLAAKLALFQESSRIFYSTGFCLPSF